MAVKREKVVQTAEKYVQRGKIEAAVKEYRKLLADFPDDATTLNRVGDLYVRLEQPDEAIKLFTQIAENYTADGFFPKATAIYKKIIKLDPTRLEVYERLAGLYHRQGLLNEARTQYQVLADYYLKHDNTTSAVSIYERMAQVDPEDPSLLARLADLYRDQKFLDKAMAQYRRIAELMLAHGAPDEAEKVYLKALDVDPQDVGFITDAVLKLKESHQVASAARFLAVAVERNPEAEQVARVVGMEQPAGGEAAQEAAEGELEASTDPVLEVADDEVGAPSLDLDAASGLDLEAEVDLEAAVESAAEALPDEAAEERPPAEAVAKFESGEITLDLDGLDDVLDLDLEDESPPASLVRPPDDMLESATEPAAQAPAETSAASGWELSGSGVGPSPGEIDADFLERTAAELHPERIQQEEDLITEAEVLVKYGLTEKAMERLGELLQLNAEHPGGLGLLIRLHLDEGQYEGAAELAGELYRLAPSSPAWTQAWEKLEASEFFLTEAGEVLPPGVEEAPEEATEAALETETTQAVAGTTVGEDAAVEEAAVGEGEEEPLFDLALELGDDLLDEAPAAAEAVGEEAVSEEAVSEEPVAEAPAAAAPPPVAEPAPAAAAAPPAARQAPRAPRRDRDVDDLLASLTAEVLPNRRRPQRPAAQAAAGAATPEPAAPQPPAAPPAAPPPAEPPPAADVVAASLEVTEPGTEWLQETAAEASSESEGAVFADEADFFDLAAELEEELSHEAELDDDDLLLSQPQEQSLEEIVEGFKKGVSESLSEEDHQTHFDLGIAYREMGLLDEAIGEFQIAAKSDRLLVECCSMLGLCFVDKGLPELAVKWYRRGLAAPGVGEEDQLGLLYDLGNAQHAMGEKEEAHKTFVDIYGTNSNYRDVVAKVEETRVR